MQKKFSAANAEAFILQPGLKNWRLVRVVEGARLESVYTRKGIKGSNPLVSADKLYIQLVISITLISIVANINGVE